jgi:hypothetical protein
VILINLLHRFLKLYFADIGIDKSNSIDFELFLCTSLIDHDKIE